MARNTKLAFLSALLLAAACDLDVEIGESETAADAMGSGDSMGSGESMDPGEPTDPTNPMDTADSGDSMDPGDSMGPDPMDPTDPADPTGADVGGPSECDPLAQDCPDGEGCDLSGGIYVCAPEGEQGEGEDCDAMQTCQAGLHCGPEAVCVPLCDPTDPAACPGEECIPLDGDALAGTCDSNPGDLSPCDPIVQDCADGEGCYPDADGGGFVCAPGGMGGPGELCEFADACVAGLTCVDGIGCTPFCDLSTPMTTCTAGLECTAYADGAAPAGFEDVGVCTLGM